VLSKILTDYGEKETEQNWERLEEGFKRGTEVIAAVPSADALVAIRRIRIPLISSVSI